MIQWQLLLPERPARQPVNSMHPAAVARRDRARVRAAAQAVRDEIETERRREHRLALEAAMAAEREGRGDD